MSNTPPVRVRAAPSPTGYVHIGNLRTVLFDFLLARKTGGKTILRIEDTDQNRKVDGAIESMLRVFKTLGLDFDEGYRLADNNVLEQQGEYGPYLQSQRLSIYHKYVEELIHSGSAYYCFCTEERLEEVKKEQVALKKPPMYDKHCRNLTAEEVQKKMTEFDAMGKRPVVRQAIPDGGVTVLHDLIYGDITFDHKVLDDQVLLKSDNFPTYHLAVVVDDHLMQISHVIRGEEWISSTPKHLLLYKAFGWEPTLFAHLPLILNQDKSKLSKRQGDVAVEDFLAKGYLPEALLNFVAFLGWNPKTEQEFFSLPELIEHFDLTKVNKAGAVFDIHKLDWLNGLYIRNKKLSELVDLLKPYWKMSGILIENYKENYLEAIASLEQERLKKLSEIGERTQYFFAEPEYGADLLVWKKSTPEETKTVLQKLCEFFELLHDGDFVKEVLEQKLREWITSQQLDNGSVLWPLRVSLTGLSASPGPFEVASVLGTEFGKNKILERLKRAVNKL